MFNASLRLVENILCTVNSESMPSGGPTTGQGTISPHTLLRYWVEQTFLDLVKLYELQEAPITVQ